MISSFVLLNKAAGISSFKAMYQLKKDTDTRKVGHCGTLDPFADGLLMALTGRITKFIPYMSDMPKTYTATLRFGEETATLDTEGEVINSGHPVPELEQITAAAVNFAGDIMQVPPSFSAVHVDGKRAYKLARKGKELDIPPKRITVYSFEILSYDKPNLVFRVSCSGGTYIRAIARDLAAMCGTVGYLTALRRNSIGGFSADGIEPGSYRLLSAREGMSLCGFPTETVPDDVGQLLKEGREFAGPFRRTISAVAREGELLALFDGSDNFCAMVGKRKGRPYYAFAAGVR